MIQFNLEDGRQVQIEREQLEEKVLEGVFTKLDQARQESAGMYNAFKQAVNMIMMLGKVDIKIPKGENTLEYLIAHYLSIGLDTLEKAPVPVIGKVVEANGETSRD